MVRAATLATLQAPEKTAGRVLIPERRKANHRLDPVDRPMNRLRPAMDPASQRISQTRPAPGAVSLPPRQRK
jgi:hypothetical protein